MYVYANTREITGIYVIERQRGNLEKSQKPKQFSLMKIIRARFFI